MSTDTTNKSENKSENKIDKKENVDDDFTLYNDKYLLNGFGFVNLGATCYFNSLLQCLLSCTSFVETIIKNRHRQKYKEHPLTSAMIQLFTDAFKLKFPNVYKSDDIKQRVSTELARYSIPIWNAMKRHAESRKDKMIFGNGQEDSNEGLMIILDMLDSFKEINKLFTHRYKTTIYCDNCNTCLVDKEDTYNVFEVQPSLTNEQHDKFKAIDQKFNTSMNINDFLKTQNTYVENFKCTKCGDKSEKFRNTVLVMVPEILPILIKRYRTITNQMGQTAIYKDNSCVQFPTELQFQGLDKVYKYKLVAQSEHSGDVGGGHYWAICERADGICRLDDGSVSSGQLGATSSSYMIFYHIV